MHDLPSTQWRKASRSSATGDNCVEVAGSPDVVGVRDSKNPSGPVIELTPQQWRNLTAGIRRSEFDL